MGISFEAHNFLLKSIPIMVSIFSLELTSNLSSFKRFSYCYHLLRMKQVEMVFEDALACALDLVGHPQTMALIPCRTVEWCLKML